MTQHQEPLRGRVWSNSSEPLVSVKGVRIVAESDRLQGQASIVVRDASFVLSAGGSLGISGESGSGKTSLVQSLFGYFRPGLRPESGAVSIRGRRMGLAESQQFVSLRGSVLAFVPQSASEFLDPIMSVGQQLLEIAQAVRKDDRSASRPRIVSLLQDVGFKDPETIMRKYPHELSGGQRQRVVLCMALLAEPDVLVMDEPTSDLDVLTQLRILKLIRELKDRHGFGLVMVSHDLRVLAALCSQLLVMYRGWVVEEGPLNYILAQPSHPYTAQLVKRFTQGPVAKSFVSQEETDTEESEVGCVYRQQCPMAAPRCLEPPGLLPLGESRAARCWFRTEVASYFAVSSSADVSTSGAPRSRRDNHEKAGDAAGLAGDYGSRPDADEILTVANLKATHKGPGLFVRRRFEVLHGITLSVRAGEAVGIVGESGSGKTTFARILAGLHPTITGVVKYGDFDLSVSARKRPLQVRRELQIVFQNPETALNPKRRVGDVLRRRVRLFEGLEGDKANVRTRELLSSVGLPTHFVGRRPGQLSGGEKQRVAIARALIGRPRIIICDEILSALDVITQARIIRLISDLQREYGLTLLFISHDIGVTGAIANRIWVFKDGTIREEGTASQILVHPREEYTRQLIASSVITIDDAAHEAD